MPAIYTGEWIKQRRKEENMSVEDLAGVCGVSAAMIYKIESGERLGSVKTWGKIINFFQPAKISVECEKIIEDLREDVALYGEQEKAIVFYSVDGGAIIFYDYLLSEEMLESPNDEDLQDKKHIEITLKEALELFEMQNELL